jgi:hypothetical protein
VLLVTTIGVVVLRVVPEFLSKGCIGDQIGWATEKSSPRGRKPAFNGTASSFAERLASGAAEASVSWVWLIGRHIRLLWRKSQNLWLTPIDHPSTMAIVFRGDYVPWHLATQHHSEQKKPILLD